MKIFNLQPITVKEYLFNEEHLVERMNDGHFEYGFSFNCSIVGSIKTMIVEFKILYSVGGSESHEEIFMTDNPNEWLVMGTSIYEDGAGEILLSYKSYCKFNLENEGFEADVISMSEFLNDYNIHTQTFLNQYKPDSLVLEDDLFAYKTLKSNAMNAIENLKGSNMYEF
ncbi:hypothetical protein QWY86_03985 [Pedobacter aquatilis]|uniref:hypothetical protein n=1 Tax=Pedobacter aquatilis TaxID=351343 RepID=UPI0025B38E05|nr:hypothetical protein [Pedobacter aquatilis]MDN3585813.1 hypothetical protein [Pedobacter aquatilis]